MNPDPRTLSEEDWRVEVSERITRLETKMNIIGYIAGASLVAVLGTLGTLVVMFVR